MTNLRAAIKCIRFLLTTLFYHSVILIGNIFAKFGFNNKPWNTNLRKHWSISVQKILKMKLTVNGTAPNPPFFLVANHLSYIDVWVLFSTAKGTFITKSDVQEWPLVGFVLRTAGMIFINRGRKADITRVNNEISKNVTQDQGVFLFPESTTSNGETILPFKSSLFQYPAQEGIDVVTSAITYRTNDENVDAASEICWCTEISFPEHFWNVLKLKEFEATITFSDQKLVHSDRKFLATNSKLILEEIFEPVKQLKTNAESNSSITV